MERQTNGLQGNHKIDGLYLIINIVTEKGIVENNPLRPFTNFI